MTYCSVSSTTMPEPLSALLITRVWSEQSSFSALLCAGVRFVVVLRGCNLLTFFLTLFRYSSIAGLAVGGVHVLFFLKGCGSLDGLSLKKCFILLLLSKLSRESDSGICGVTLLGTKVRPRERTSICGGLRVFEERLVIYFSLFISLFISF